MVEMQKLVVNDYLLVIVVEKLTFDGNKWQNHE